MTHPNVAKKVIQKDLHLEMAQTFKEYMHNVLWKLAGNIKARQIAQAASSVDAINFREMLLFFLLNAATFNKTTLPQMVVPTSQHKFFFCELEGVIRDMRRH